jgi:hypothetical protein
VRGSPRELQRPLTVCRGVVIPACAEEHLQDSRIRFHPRLVPEEAAMKRSAAALVSLLLGLLMALVAPPAFAAEQDRGRLVTVEEFVCFFSAGDMTRLARGIVITTPSGEPIVICTGQRL